MKKALLSLLFLLALLLGCLPLATRAQVTFIVNQLPTYTPANSTLYIAGNFNNWNPGSAAYALSQQPDSSWHITLPPGSGSISFKFTRGSWASVEGSISGNQIPNRSFTYGNGDTVYVSILSWEDLHGGGGGGGQSTANAQVQLLTDSFYLPHLYRYRRIWLYLPPDYQSQPQKRYPVIYMHDGQNLFDNLTAFAGEWEVDESMSQLHAQGDHGAIIVGIDNGGSNRVFEYSPWLNPTYGGGQGDFYINSIVYTLKPYIDQHYRTDTSRAGTAMIGSSMGGLISQYGAMKYQNVFSKVGVFSPSFWFHSNIYAQVTDMGRQQPMRFYYYTGGQESANMVAQVTQMHYQMSQNGFASHELKLTIRNDGQHSESYWADAFKPAYLWLFRTSAASTEALTEEQVRLYPNPARDWLRLEWATNDSATYQLIDMQGGLRLQGQIAAGEQLDLTSLAAGVYHLQLQLGRKLHHHKLVIQ